MARILLTGFTAKQRGEGRPQVATLLCGAERALRYRGHHVERRKVDPGEDLREQFDCAVVAIYDYRGTSATAQKFNAMRACLDLPHVLAWDDWNANAIFNSVRKGPADFWALGLHTNDRKVQRQQENLRELFGSRVDVLVDGWSRRVPKMLCCAFNWGDHDKLRAVHEFGELCCWDPSPWVRGMHGAHAVDKQRAWALASLANHDDWLRELEPSWDVHKQAKPWRGRGWQVEESYVVSSMYATSWGVLSPPYPFLAGSGWWRNRFVFAQDAGCVVYADPSEVAPALGKLSHFYWTLDEVECMSDSKLRELASAQLGELTSRELAREESAEQLSGFVLSCMG